MFNRTFIFHLRQFQSRSVIKPDVCNIESLQEQRVKSKSIQEIETNVCIVTRYFT
jgi:hypothetical protein